MKGIIFQHLYEDTYGYIKKNIIFPQNFVPVLGLEYKNLRIQHTSTGKFIFEGKTYFVSRAYHSDFDDQGNPIDKVASIGDTIDYMFKDKSKLDNPFNVLSKLEL